MIVAVFGPEIPTESFTEELERLCAKRFDAGDMLLLQQPWMSLEALSALMTAPYDYNEFDSMWPTYSPKRRAIAALNVCDFAIFMLPKSLLRDPHAKMHGLVEYAVTAYALKRHILTNYTGRLDELIRQRINR
jgi:hypothetical protein